MSDSGREGEKEHNAGLARVRHRYLAHSLYLSDPPPITKSRHGLSMRMAVPVADISASTRGKSSHSDSDWGSILNLNQR